MGKLFTSLKSISKRTWALVAVSVAAVAVPATLFAWGPDRQVYTIENPADHVTFNSITNNPNIGDERNFVTVREAGTNGTWNDNQTVQPGKEYVVRMYVHNNAAANLNKVAENVKAKFNLPTTTGKSVQVNGFLNSSNATPTEVYDHAVFSSTEDFNLAYKAGTLKYFTNASPAQGFDIPESALTNSGALLGYDKLDGKIPGCFQYAGYLVFTVKPQFATPTPDFTINKQVRKPGDKTFVESVDAKSGDTLNYRINVANTGQTQLNNINLKDTLPKGVKNVPGTVRIMNANNPNGAYIQDGDKLFTTGVNIGSYTAGSNALVIFDATVESSNELPVCGPNKLTNIASAKPEGQNPKEDGADVKVPKECQPDCKYTCDELKVDKLSDTTFKFTTSTTEANATFKKVTYIIRNEQGAEVERKESTQKTLDYTRTTVGKFTVEALVTFSVNGQDKTVTHANCKKPFEVTEQPMYTCDSLTVTKLTRTSFKFAVTHTVKGGTLKSTQYVVRNEQGTEIARQTSPDYTQATVGKYTVEAILTFTINGQDKVVSDPKCKAPFEVEKQPETPVYTCDSLTYSKISRLEYSFTGKATAEGGATIVNYAFNFGDNTPVQTVTNPIAVKHTYAKDGEYPVSMSVRVKVGNEEKVVDGPNCKVKVPVSPEECKPGIPVNHPSCKEECKPGIPMGDAQCEDKPCVPGKDAACTETPKELPKTGAGDGIVALIGAGSLIAALGYYIASRRQLGA